MGSAEFQGKIWGARAQDWADYGEGTSNDLFNAILDKINSPAGASLLDAGCGAGGFCVMAVQRRINVSGIDASESLISIAKKRIPGADFRVGELEQLPFHDKTFDFVTGINSFQFAEDIVQAFREAKRVTVNGGKITAVIWSKPEDCEATAIFSALAPYMPQQPPKKPGRKPLFTDGVLEDLAVNAGLNPGEAENIECIWNFENEATAVRGILSAGGIVTAIEINGEQKIGEIVSAALQQFRHSTGAYRLKNTFKCMVCTL
jgi:SAM-dependent methyltransferase